MTTHKLPLSNGGFSLIDQEDLEKVSSYTWMVNYNGSNNIVETTKKPRQSLSRMIMDAPNDKLVDHINGNTLDNRKENLRLCSYEENSRNTRLYSTNTSGFRGVQWSKGDRRWKVRITVKFKRIYLGVYKNILDAARAYDEAAKKYHGEFASLNFPRSDSA